VGVAVNVFEAGLVHVLMRVFGAVFVRVGMLVCDMVVLMRGVRMCMGHIAMVVLVRMRAVMAVLVCHSCRLLVSSCEMVVITSHSPGAWTAQAPGGDGDSATAFSPLSPR
jgi:hypothetical protein